MELLLDEREQAAARAVIAVEPVPGAALPGACALPPLSRLIPCDAIGLALLDGTGTVVEDSAVPRHATTVDDLDADGPRLGIHQLDRTPAGAASCARRTVAVLSLGVHNGPDHVVELWLVRRANNFVTRDRSLLVLVAPALERLMRERPMVAFPPSLTLQERRVLGQIAAGLSNAEIAQLLFIAPCTVRKHLEHAYRKLGVSNRMAAVFALESSHPGGSAWSRSTSPHWALEVADAVHARPR